MDENTRVMLIWQAEQLTRESRRKDTGGLWAILAAPIGERNEVSFVDKATDRRRLANAHDPVIRGVFTTAIANARRQHAVLDTESLRATVAVYKVPGAPDWQTVLIDRDSVADGWWSNGIDTAVAAEPGGMDALGFLSLALPELLADLVHGPGRGTFV
ncbi:hypothetical protein [Glycomyces sp. NRRL B-16210]|uniref:hypothetical protein n=1 Tax=Glycomyces sp. NRRL B-16210 TaxID=1463821 RepID=UPI0004C28AB7|nr:hypothetical protein [Glycomyces sp. NRRL B-16210]